MPDKTNKFIETPYRKERFLIITADDFGASKNINEGIKRAADKNAITTISALTNFTESIPELKSISLDHPEIGIGVHLNITTGKSVLEAKLVPTLVKANGDFYPLEKLLAVLGKISINEIRNELRAQIEVQFNEGIKIDHLSDQNGILTLYSPFFDILIELATEYKVPVRSPEIAGIKYPQLFPDSKMQKHGRNIATRFALSNPAKARKLIKYTRKQEISRKVLKLNEMEIPHPDLLIEYLWGNPTQANLNHILEHLPEGISELILHLGNDTRQYVYPGGLDLEYFNSREKELALITKDSLVDYYRYLNIKPIGYQEIVSGK